jgi:hypothetical protein
MPVLKTNRLSRFVENAESVLGAGQEKGQGRVFSALSGHMVGG